MQPRGIRNNNPGNLRRSKDHWVGLSVVQDDPDFFQFIGAAFGIRALAKTLRTYQTKHGLRSIRELIGRWAPAQENNTQAYVKSVAESCRVEADQAINLGDPQLLAAVVTAIIRHENGEQPYAPTLIRQGVDMA